MTKLARNTLTTIRLRMGKLSLAAPVAAALVLAAPVERASADTLFAFTAMLQGAQEVPPNTSPSHGVAFLTYNKQQKLLCYSISFSPLSGTEVLAHFHGPAQPGENGGVLFDITGPDGPSPVGTSKWGCVGPLDKPQARDLAKGLWYINVHSTPDFPGGEIRGQVLPTGLQYKKAEAIPFSPSGAFLDGIDF
jgi:hypothetical protein